ncbi:hypothetical protein KKG05_03935, partial [bacterium]|nr:hypothetical protein [bacterium]
MRILRLSLPILFLVFGIGILLGWIFPGLPEGTGMRPMLGLVTILFGLYRGSVFLFVPPEKRRPYGGHREKFLKREHETSTG